MFGDSHRKYLALARQTFCMIGLKGVGMSAATDGGYL
jgi:hypothetical protein